MDRAESLETAICAVQQDKQFILCTDCDCELCMLHHVCGTCLVHHIVICGAPIYRDNTIVFLLQAIGHIGLSSEWTLGKRDRN